MKLFFLGTDLERTGAIGIMLLWVIKISKMQHELKQHVRFHTKEKLYKCEICQGKFRLNYHILCHIRRKHSHEKRFAVMFVENHLLRTKNWPDIYWRTKCETYFQEKYNLRRHIDNFHHEIIRFSCKPYGQSSKKKCNLSFRIELKHPFLNGVVRYARNHIPIQEPYKHT